MPREDGFEGLIGHRSSVEAEFDPDLSPQLSRVVSAPQRNGFHESIFARELGWLLPYDRDEETNFTVRLETEDPEIDELFLDSLPTYYPPRSLRDGVREFADDCVQRLIYGPVALEVELFTKADGAPAREFAIHYLRAGTVHLRRGLPIQLVPGKAPSSKKNYRGHPYVNLDPSTLVIIDIGPRERAIIEHSLRTFGLVDSQQFLAVDVLTDRKNRHIGFDAEEHRRQLQIILLRETRQLGWTNSLEGIALDPYKVWRHLQFARLQIGMRTTILSGLQKAIDKAGVRNGFKAELRVGGVLELDAVIAAERALEIGDASIASLLRL